MRNDILKAQWKLLRGRIQQAYRELTDEDMARIDGNWDQLVNRIEERTGLLRTEIENRLDDLIEPFTEAAPRRDPKPAAE